MADNEQAEGAAEGEEGAPKGSKRKFIILGAAALVLILGGASGYFLFFNKKHDEKTEEVATAKPSAFVEVPELMVNLSAAAGERVQYLKLKIVLEVKDPMLGEEIKPVLPRVTDVFQTYMRDLRPADLNGSAGMFRLKEELTRRVNAAISPKQVNAVLFKEILVQ